MFGSKEGEIAALQARKIDASTATTRARTPAARRLSGDGMFVDRTDAGRRLAGELRRLKQETPVVLALPRGGVPVAYEVARALDAPLDLLLIRKIGAPGQPELALGAVMDGDRPETGINEEGRRLFAA